MEYPIWMLQFFGGGFWIAFIATVHVYVAHFAVGGGLFLVLSERYAVRHNSPGMLAFTRKHTRFFLLLSMVFGAVTGVGIWFTIALLSPQATITLIHNFVFAWTTEWVFFLGEIVALLIYHYSWDTMNRTDHQIVGWIYFLCGWSSLFVINGIVGFMLTPGHWIETKNFWDGFFNPTFWPQLCFRSFLSMVCAGLFGFVTATRLEDEELRAKVVSICAKWTLVGIALTIACGYWYFHALPAPQFDMVSAKSHRVASYLKLFWVFGGLVVGGGLLLGMKMPRKAGFALALAVLLIGLGFFGSFEFMREAGRKPYVIWNYIYSNSILKERVPELNQAGILPSAKWTPPELRTITGDNRLKAGAFLFQLECASCHSVGGLMNDILPRTAPLDLMGMDAMLSGLGKLTPYMPPFVGTQEERFALAAYLVKGLHRDQKRPEVVVPEQVEPVIPHFDRDEDEYVLLAWPAKGMNTYVKTDLWTLGQAGNTLRARLLRREGLPEDASKDASVSYAVESGFSSDAPQGSLALTEPGLFEGFVPVEAYKDTAYNPMPTVTLEALDNTGKVLAVTRVAAPVSDQLGCLNCHGGNWQNMDSGMSRETAAEVLATHDRMNHTNLLNKAQKGQPVQCLECHGKADPGPDGPLNLSAAIHGAHAVYLAGRGGETCTACHPKNTLRGLHADGGLECVDCHGHMEEHSLALLKGEQARGAKAADRFLALITPQAVPLADIKPRTPWIQEPDCITCHANFAPPDVMDGFNTWTEDGSKLFSIRRDEADAMECAACHGSPHAVYPASIRDNIPPVQYTGEARVMGADGTCAICHLEVMDFAAHHPGMGLPAE